jgi:hypothetical protein
MTKDEIVKELSELGEVLYSKFGTDSYLERCTIHDLKTKIKALNIHLVVGQSEQLKADRKMGIDKWRESKGLYFISKGKFENTHGTIVNEKDVKDMYQEYLSL